MVYPTSDSNHLLSTIASLLKLMKGGNIPHIYLSCNFVTHFKTFRLFMLLKYKAFCG